MFNYSILNYLLSIALMPHLFFIQLTYDWVELPFFLSFFTIPIRDLLVPFPMPTNQLVTWPLKHFIYSIIVILLRHPPPYYLCLSDFCYICMPFDFSNMNFKSKSPTWTSMIIDYSESFIAFHLYQEYSNQLYSSHVFLKKLVLVLLLLSSFI